MINEIDSKEDYEKLNRILLSRDIQSSFPYKAEFIYSPEITDWLTDNCNGKYRIKSVYSQQSIVFEQEDDFTLYQLTWG